MQPSELLSLGWMDDSSNHMVPHVIKFLQISKNVCAYSCYTCILKENIGNCLCTLCTLSKSAEHPLNHCIQYRQDAIARVDEGAYNRTQCTKYTKGIQQQTFSVKINDYAVHSFHYSNVCDSFRCHGAECLSGLLYSPSFTLDSM